MNNKISQTGIATLELLLLIAVLLALTGIGVFVYSKQRGQQSPVVTSSQSVPTPEGTSTSPNGIPGGAASTPPPTSANSQNTVKIASAGIQIGVPDSLKDLTYSTSAANGVTSLTFSTTALTTAIPSCAASQGAGAFSTIIKGNGTYPGPTNPSSGGILKQYDNYYIAYTLPTGPCAKNLSVENQNLLNNLSQDFYGSLSSVQGL